MYLHLQFKLLYLHMEKRKVVGYESLYEVDDLGNVYSLRKWRGIKNRILTPSKNEYGYMRVNLTKNGKTKGITVHKIVTRAFIGEMEKGQQVRHLDGNKNNNSVSNLKYGTAKENADDRNIHKKTAFGSKIGSSKLSESEVLEIRSQYKKRGDMVKLAEKFNVSCANIYYIINNKSRKNG